MAQLHSKRCNTFYAILLYAIVVCHVRETSAVNDAAPHIVIIMADDLGFDDVSFRGSREIITPNIDSLAYHGKILNRFYVPAGGAASRAALLTGKYPIHIDMQDYTHGLSVPWCLPTNLTTMAELFQQAGYVTNLVGKWHLGFGKRICTPTHRGFDYHYGFWGDHIDYLQHTAKIPQTNFSFGYDFRRNSNVECTATGTYLTDLLTTEAERLIMSNNNTKPLFLMVTHLAPHRADEQQPLQALIEELKKCAHIKDPERRKYAAMVSSLDLSVGRIIRALDRVNSLQNSIVIFYSDNGAPTQGTSKNAGSNWPLRGQKNTPWEGGVRVAAAIWSPLLIDRTTSIEQIMHVTDLLPTLAGAAGITLPSDLQLDGLNQWHKLSGLTDNNHTVERDIVHYLSGNRQIAAISHGPWKYINGTNAFGAFDNVLSYREEYDIDPRELRYVVEVRNSLTSQKLSTYDDQRLSMRRIERVRQHAAIRCGQLRRSCNALIDECLFNIVLDPCEQNNLAYEQLHAATLAEMRLLLEKYRASAVVHERSSSIATPAADPAKHNCAWSNFLEETVNESRRDCDYNVTPCGTTK